MKKKQILTVTVEI